LMYLQIFEVFGDHEAGFGRIHAITSNTSRGPTTNDQRPTTND
jgi:hypothetical protein